MKIFKSLLLFVLALTITLNSRPSQAGVGALVAAPVVVVAGLVTAGIGGAGVIAVVACAPNCGEGAVPVGFFGAILLGLGLIILDGEQQVQFNSLSVAEANKLNLSSAERMSFNAEIDQVNALTSFVSEEVVSQKIQNSEEAAQVWNNVKDLVSADTFSAMVKVANQNSQN